MNPSEFADYIGISRSSINHILTARNNPSLDVVLKILAKFDKISSDWLLSGKEPMYRGNSSTSFQQSRFDNVQQPSLFDHAEPEPKRVAEISVHPKDDEIKTSVKEPNLPLIEDLASKMPVQKKITKILIFYSDNTFDSLSPDF
jgi:transcriptional regulator with XRE-family HTH domain